MFITGIGTAAPRKRLTQREGWESLQTEASFAKLTPRSRAILKKVLCGDNGIETRHFVLDEAAEAFEPTPDILQARFAKHAPILASEAARLALADAGCAATDIDAILVSTCTGYLCPGLSSYVVEQAGLRSDIFALDLVGQGCGAALPNLRTADALLAAGRAKKVLSICVEICSAAFYLDNDPGVLISACLFGDGAGAVVLSNEPQPGRRSVEWKFGASHLKPGDRDQLRFEHKDGMLRNILSPQVPKLAGNAVVELLNESLAQAGVDREEIAGWILHAGGRDILVALRDKLGLTESDTRHSAAILREFGNISSPSVLFVLEAALKDSVPDGAWWMSSFGAGFSCHGALLEVSGPKN
ncbi:MAG TPA: type III polyketide synthase [Verrucomicrobiae bacterium]|nr:type III polyketide synthase [Verrucomicrobiae bacterium]